MSQLGLSTLLNAAFDAIGLALPGPWRWVYANAQFADWLGAFPEDVVGAPVEATFDSDTQRQLIQAAEEVWRGDKEQSTLRVRLATDDDSLPPIEVRICRVEGDEPMLGVIMHRVAERTRSVSTDAIRLDPLTNLPDRTFLLTRLGQLMQGDREADKNFAVLFVDLDDFKRINDRYGHLVGDRVLKEAAARLSQSVREGDHVVRFGGDEFIVLVEQITGWPDIEAIINRIRDELARPIELPSGEVTLSLSVGVAEASPEHRTPEDLLLAADRAMYASKPVRA